jgi:hypothetical protein
MVVLVSDDGFSFWCTQVAVTISNLGLVFSSKTGVNLGMKS